MRERKALQALIDPRAIALFLLLVLPWHIAACVQQQDFAWFYVVNEHFLRFLGLRQPHDYHIEPFYYYAPRLPLMLLPWTPLLLLFFRSAKPGSDPIGIVIRFCRAWILFPLLFFSISRAKGGYYLLVILPAIALWLGIEITRRTKLEIDRTLAICIGITLLLVAMALGIALFFTSEIRMPLTRMDSTIAIGVICTTIGFFYSYRKIIVEKHPQTQSAAIVIIGLVTAPLLSIILHTAQVRSAKDSSEEIASIIQRQTVTNIRTFTYRDYEDVFSSLPFYLRKKIVIIDSVSQDLQFGCGVTQAEDSACLSLSAFKNYHQHFPVAVAVAHGRLEDFFKAAGRSGWRSEMVGNKQVLFNF
ncbi:hypothetical protein BH11PSE12_BH11PSE12_04620 [soil metagenome]